MDNKRKRTIRRVLSGAGLFSFIFSGVVYAGLQFPFFNSYNPLYSPYFFMLFGLGFFIGRTFVKDKRKIGNYLDFFGRSGLVEQSYEVPFENIKPTHVNYVNKEGEKQSIRHGHPFAIPGDDEWTNEYLVPSNGLEALNPAELVDKYALQITETERQVLLGLQEKIPELSAIDPQVLHTEMAKSDDVDGLNQEAAYQTAEIRKGWFSGSTKGQMILYIFLGVMVGAMAMFLVATSAKLDFAHISPGVINP